MGQSCFARITIVAKDSLPEEFVTPDELIKALQNFYTDKNDGEKISHINIASDLLYSDSIVEFEMYSERIANLEFQLDLLVHYLKFKNIKIEEFQSSGYVELGSCNRFLEPEYFENI